MGGREKINPMRQYAKIKEYLGWFIAFMVPFTLRGILDVTKIPLISVLIYWLLCGIILRYTIEKDFPYFRPKFRIVKKDIIIMIVVSVLCGYVYYKGIEPSPLPVKELILSIIFFGIINGMLEQLIWINIYELAGCKIKLSGILATAVYIMLNQTLFWGKFMPVVNINVTFFIILQTVMFLIPLSIYRKTNDLTLWSIQHVAYNIFIVCSGGFSISTFIHI